MLFNALLAGDFSVNLARQTSHYLAGRSQNSHMFSRLNDNHIHDGREHYNCIGSWKGLHDHSLIPTIKKGENY